MFGQYNSSLLRCHSNRVHCIFSQNMVQGSLNKTLQMVKEYV
jgi:hypothetical protein